MSNSTTVVLNAKKPATKRVRTSTPKSYINTWDISKANYVRFSFRVDDEEKAESILESLYNRGAIDWSYVHGFKWPKNEEKGLEAKTVIHGLARIKEKSFDWKFFKDTLPAKAFVKTSFYPEGTYPNGTHPNKLPTSPAKANLQVIEEGKIPQFDDEENITTTF